MAIDEINSEGGVFGQAVEFAYGDHQGDEQICAQVVDKLIDEGADFLIGPMVSGMASSVIDAAAPHNILVIGPTVSTDELTGIDDNFIRGVAPASFQGIYLARVMAKEALGNVVFVIDGRNSTYADALMSGFEKEMGDLSDIVKARLFFEGKDDFPSVVEALEKRKPDGLVFVASGIDSAGIIQLYAKENQLPRLYGGSWTKVTDIINYAGKTVEGMVIIDSFANMEPLDREKAFYRKYEDLYGIKPNIAAISAYESVMLIIDGIRLAGSVDSDKVKQTILGMRDIEGIADTFHIDQYGDGVRGLSTVIVENGEYKILEELVTD